MAIGGEFVQVFKNELVIGQEYNIFVNCINYLININTTTHIIKGTYLGNDYNDLPEFNSLSVWPGYPNLKYAYNSDHWTFYVYETYKDKMKKARSRMHNDVFPYDFTLKEELMRVVWHPERLEQLIRQGYSVDEVFDSLGPYVCGIGRNTKLTN